MKTLCGDIGMKIHPLFWYENQNHGDCCQFVTFCCILKTLVVGLLDVFFLLPHKNTNKLTFSLSSVPLQLRVSEFYCTCEFYHPLVLLDFPNEDIF